MAGALTANSVTSSVLTDVMQIEPVTYGVVEFLSPVDGANNTLLTAIFVLEEGDEAREATFQWYRCAPGSTVPNATPGDTVGPAFTIAIGDSEAYVGPFCVVAIDRGAGPTSAYAFTGVLDETGAIITVDDIYVDAVLYD